MKRLLGLLLVMGMVGCGAETNPPITSMESGRKRTPPPTAEKMENQIPPAAVEIPDAATVKELVTPEQLAVGDVITNSIGIVLVPIPAGEFLMGSPATEPLRRDNETQHRVKISKPFYLGACEITVGQYEQVMGTIPSHFRFPNHPVETVSWEDVVSFCRKLSARPGEQEAGRVYRLPTEAEWEYACRAGTTTAYNFADDPAQLAAHGWFRANSDDMSHPIGQKKPNPFGLYDMHGNVWEWCLDWYGDFQADFTVDPTGPETSMSRIRRGGSWENDDKNGRSSHRSYLPPDYCYCKLGFRVALSPAVAGDR